MTPKELKDFRKGKKMNQAELAERLGVSRKTVVNWEGGIFTVPSDLMQRMVDKGIVDAPPAEKLTQTDKDAVAQYTKMRQQPGHTGTHAGAMAIWAKFGFVPSPAAVAAIRAVFPDAAS